MDIALQLRIEHVAQRVGGEQGKHNFLS
jgi:hypothetical protein